MNNKHTNSQISVGKKKASKPSKRLLAYSELVSQRAQSDSLLYLAKITYWRIDAKHGDYSFRTLDNGTDPSRELAIKVCQVLEKGEASTSDITDTLDYWESTNQVRKALQHLQIHGVVRQRSEHPYKYWSLTTHNYYSLPDVFFKLNSDEKIKLYLAKKRGEL